MMEATTHSRRAIKLALLNGPGPIFGKISMGNKLLAHFLQVLHAAMASLKWTASSVIITNVGRPFMLQMQRGCFGAVQHWHGTVHGMHARLRLDLKFTWQSCKVRCECTHRPHAHIGCMHEPMFPSCQQWSGASHGHGTSVRCQACMPAYTDGRRSRC